MSKPLPVRSQGTRMSNIGPQDIEGAASAVLGIWTQMLWENVGNDGIHMDLCLIDIIERS